MGEEGLVDIPLSVESHPSERGKEIDLEEKHPYMGDTAASIPQEHKDSAGDEGNQYISDFPTQDSGAKITDQAENSEDSERKLAGHDQIDSDEQWSQKIFCPPSPFPQPAPPPGLATPGPTAPEEFHLSDLKVIVQPRQELDDKDVPIDGQGRGEIKGRVAFFSRSSCRDCGAVRSFLRDKSLPYIEINIDVFPSREKELIQRTASAAVPKIFVNEKLLGGLEALNALRNSGEFDRTVREIARERCPETAPRAPIYGLDDEDVLAGRERTDEMAEIVRVLRQKVAVTDRLVKMTFVKKCFPGSELVEAIIHHLDCGRKKGVEVAKELARKHFIHHVFRENEFEDANHQFYRFLEHDPVIPKCFNFRGSTNDNEPKPVTEVACRLTKLMTAILEAYASDDRHHLDYARISVSEEFRRYVNMVQDLQRVDVFTLSGNEKLTFFMNLYNAMVIHAIVRVNRRGIIDRRSAFFSDFHYMIGGYPYSLSSIKDGILRSNRRQPYSISKPFSTGDRRLELVPPKPNLLIHFGLCDGTRSSPIVRFFSTQGIEAELRHAAREFFHGGEAEVDLENRIVRLTGIIKWYGVDFGQDKEIWKWLLDYLDASKAGLLMHLLNDGGPIKIVYKKYDWSLNY